MRRVLPCYTTAKETGWADVRRFIVMIMVMIASVVLTTRSKAEEQMKDSSDLRNCVILVELGQGELKYA